MFGRTHTKGWNGRPGSSGVSRRRRAASRSRVLALEELERRQLLSAVAQVRGSVTGGVIDQNVGPTSAEITRSDHGVVPIRPQGGRTRGNGPRRRPLRA